MYNFDSVYYVHLVFSKLPYTILINLHECNYVDAGCLQAITWVGEAAWVQLRGRN